MPSATDRLAVYVLCMINCEQDPKLSPNGRDAHFQVLAQSASIAGILVLKHILYDLPPRN